MHSITLPQDPEELRKNIFDLTATLLACGIDPERSILFQQSTVPMHAELCWILACITTMPRLAQLPQFKEKSENLKNISLGLYIYPVLQSADILLYKATHVPVGEDQLQHLQLAQHLANLFNNKFGKTFPLPHSIINDTSGRIKSLREPTKKMSKSSDSARSKIELTDTPDVILRKIKRSVTDFTSEVTYEPEKRPGVSNLVSLHSLSSGKSPQDICKECQGMDTGKYKLVVADALIEHLTPIRQKYSELIEEPDYLENVLKNGTRKALEIASQSWPDIKEKIGFGNGSLNTMASASKIKVKS
ncbi:tryptophan--tRNA ligase, mitochondrial isoform X2 [Venturia canescens]|nr:tryptophan--tRNA ligase, mitochondrial isoform X2 [Venturia canescens]